MSREVPHRHTLIHDFFANPEVAINAIAIDEFGVLMNFVGLVGELPGGRRKIESEIDLGARVAVLLSTRGLTDRKTENQQRHDTERFNC